MSIVEATRAPNNINTQKVEQGKLNSFQQTLCATKKGRQTKNDREYINTTTKINTNKQNIYQRKIK